MWLYEKLYSKRPRSLQELSLLLLTLAGLNPFYSRRIVAVCCLLLFATNSVFLYLACCDLIAADAVELVTQRLYIILIYIVALVYSSAYYYNQCEIQWLLNAKTYFLQPTNSFKQQITVIERKIFKFFTAVIVVCHFTFVRFAYRAFMVQGLILEQPMPKAVQYKRLLSSFHIALFLINMWTIIGGVLMSAYFLTSAGMQFMILNAKLRNCAADRLNKYIIYHKFLIRYCKVINNFLSIITLMITMLVTALVCLSAFNLTLESTDFNDRIFYVLVLIIVLTLFALFCLPTSLLSNEAEKVAISIYQSDWYDFPLAVKKSMLIIMARSQVEFNIKAGKLFPINNYRLIQVVRLAFSVLTLLLKLKDKE